MSNKYEDLIKNARVNAECGEHMSPEEVTALLNVVETTFSALAAENAGLIEQAEEVYAAGYNHGHLNTVDGIAYADCVKDDFYGLAVELMCEAETPATDAFLAEVRASAVDEVCLKISNAIVNCYQDEQVGLDAAATICGDFASEIRKGVQS
ncbi:hypothetical protein [Enterobacter cloacae]|uniref:hypothetical protein n=1 Tax=Enterobacter cloacae TaxID=550 RepID=UPI001A94412E|nr:hypothetical protein [Enterobacter cloacae]